MEFDRASKAQGTTVDVQVSHIIVYHCISMKTTLEVDKLLLDQVKEILGTRTIKDTVEQSLRAVIRGRALERLADSAGTVEMDLTVTRLRRQRRKRIPSASR